MVRSSSTPENYLVKSIIIIASMARTEAIYFDSRIFDTPKCIKNHKKRF